MEDGWVGLQLPTDNALSGEVSALCHATEKDHVTIGTAIPVQISSAPTHQILWEYNRGEGPPVFGFVGLVDKAKIFLVWAVKSLDRAMILMGWKRNATGSAHCCAFNKITGILDKFERPMTLPCGSLHHLFEPP